MPATSDEVMPSWRALSWAMSTRTTLPGSFQSKVGGVEMRVRGHELGELERLGPHRLDVGAADPVLDRPADRRPEVERMHEDVDADELVGAELPAAAPGRVRAPRSTSSRRRSGRRTRWRAAGRAAGRSGSRPRPRRSSSSRCRVLSASSPRSGPSGPWSRRWCCSAAASCRPAVRPVGDREELLLDVAHADDRDGQQADAAQDRDPAPAHGADEHRGEQARQAPGLRRSDASSSSAGS